MLITCFQLTATFLRNMKANSTNYNGKMVDKTWWTIAGSNTCNV